MKSTLVLRGILAAAVISATPMMAAFIPVSSPDAVYLGGTSYIDIEPIGEFSLETSITDGNLTVSFDIDVQKRTVDKTWATWSAAPESQRATSGTPFPVLFSDGATSLTMTLSQGVQIFGFEAEPNPYSFRDMTAQFYDSNNNLLGEITRSVNGSAGARLFAASSTTPIASVVFSSSDDFAIGGVRYYNPVPEPSTYLLSGMALALGLAARRRR